MRVDWLSYGKQSNYLLRIKRPSAGKQAPQTHLKANNCLFLFSLKKKKKKHVRLKESRSENVSDLNLQATKTINKWNK